MYEKGPARPTGGVGAFAMLVGPSAPLVLLRERSSHTADVYDFYKPSMGSEYPAVDGKLSMSCYLRALDDCYEGLMGKLARAAAAGGRPAPRTAMDAFNYLVFHSPYEKLVQQSFLRLMYNDFRRHLALGQPASAVDADLMGFAHVPYEESFHHKGIEKALRASALGDSLYKAVVGPSTGLSQNIGNSYTGALYANIAALVSGKGAALAGSRIGCFSYGSGAIATFFGFEVGGGVFVCCAM